MKMPLRPLALLGLLPLLLAGCLEIDTLVTVRPDGSGTVREKVAFSGELAAMIREMDTAGGGGPMDREELVQRSARMGTGVALESAETLPEGEGFGYVAVWSFADVNQLRVVQDAEGSVPGEDGGGEEAPTATFRFEPGATPVLHVQSSLAEAEASTETAPPVAAGGDDAAQVPPEMLREMFGGLRFSFAVEVEGAIVETNAAHRNGSRVTLLELDFDELLANERAVQALSASDSPDPMDMQAVLRGLPGLEVETARSVRIAFSGSGATTAAADTAAIEAATDTNAADTALATAAPEMTETAQPPPSQPASASAESPSTLPSGSIGGYAWNKVQVGSLAGRVGELVAVRGPDGALTKGMVLGANEGRLRLRRAGMDGGGTVELPLDSLQAASVFEREG